MIIVHGLRNCDTCRKALAWLRDLGIDHEFRDVRVDGLGDIAAWLEELGPEVLVNRRGTTWRSLPEQERTGLDGDGAARLVRDHPALMKRPVFDLGHRRVVGFTEATRDILLAECRRKSSA